MASEGGARCRTRGHTFKTTPAEAGLGTFEAIPAFKPAADAGALNKYSAILTQQKQQGGET